jgi:hypothetical protein
MKEFARQRGQPVDISTKPIDPELKACILTELWAHPGSRVVKRKGQPVLSKRKRPFRNLVRAPVQG